MKENGDKTRNWSIRVSKELKSIYEEIAKERHTQPQEEARRALADYIEKRRAETLLRINPQFPTFPTCGDQIDEKSNDLFKYGKPYVNTVNTVNTDNSPIFRFTSPGQTGPLSFAKNDEVVK